MTLRPVYSDKPLELPLPEPDTKLTREFLSTVLGQKQAVIDRLLGVEPT